MSNNHYYEYVFSKIFLSFPINHFITVSGNMANMIIFLINIFNQYIYKLTMIDLSLEKNNKHKEQSGSKFTHHDIHNLELKATPALRVAFNHWIRSLPMEERFLAVKIYCPPLPQTLRSILPQIEAFSSSRSSDVQLLKVEPVGKGDAGSELKRLNRRIEKGFYQSLVLISDGQEYLDHICFDYGLLECPEKLFDLLMTPLQNLNVRPLHHAIKNRSSPETVSQAISNSIIVEQIILEVLNYLRQEVLLRFRESMTDESFISRNLEQEKRRKKQFSLHWKHSNEQCRQKILLLNHCDVLTLTNQLKSHEINIDLIDMESQISQLIKLQKNEFCNRIFKCKLKKIMEPIVSYYELVYSHWRKEIQKYKKRKNGKYSKNQREFTTHQKLQKDLKSNNKKHKQKKHRKSTSVESNETNVTEKQLINQKLDETVKFKLKSEQQFQINEFKAQEQKKTNQRVELKLNKLSQELHDVSDRISEQANQYHERRVIAYERIQFLLNYYNIQIKLFGSCASGIAIRNSDIDIAINNSLLSYFDFIPQNQRVKAALERVEQLFKTQPWINNIRFIKTAAIPVIKMNVNTAIPFLDASFGQIFVRLNRIHSVGSIEADITIQTFNKSLQCNHLGLISTEAIQKWLTTIPSLHSIVIFMKELFTVKKLNITYEGGLNTFGMIVLLVSYIYHAQLQEQTNSALVFQKLLTFYSKQFNEKETGIDLENHKIKEIFYSKKNNESTEFKSSKQQADLQMRDPMNHQNNMSRNCYQFPAIKQLFSQILQKCFNKRYKQTNQSNNQEQKQSNCKTMQSLAQRNVFAAMLNQVDSNF